MKVTDPYLQDTTCVERLYNEYKQYGQLIVAFDYDNTVYDYNKRGFEFTKVINLLRSCKSLGFHLTVFTSCNEDRFDDIRKYLNMNEIPFDSINETPDYIPFRGRKVYYNILLDDRAGLSSAYNILESVICNIRMEKENDMVLNNGGEVA